MGDRTDLLQGTLDLLVLKTLLLGPLHGWGISKRIGQLSEDVLAVEFPDAGRAVIYAAAKPAG